MMEPERTLNASSIVEPEPERGGSSADGNGAGVSTSTDLQSLTTEPSGTRGLSKRKATGPRTEAGKQRASRNSTKHGVHSKALLLPGETPNEYKRLLAGLRAARQPEGAQEELLVEDLAFIELRKRRLRVAEWAVIRKNREFLEWDQRNRPPEKIGMKEWAVDYSSNHGLIQTINNPDVLKRCLQMLSGLQELFEENSFNPEHGKTILEKIYGERDSDLLREDLYDNYETWQCTLAASEEEREHGGYASPEECRRNIIRKIKKEVRRLKNYQRERASIEAKRTQLEVLSRSVPDFPVLDRLLRYEVHLNRESDRLLSRLEVLQRMRLGQPVPPRIAVDLK
jgi:hypothetical protein